MATYTCNRCQAEKDSDHTPGFGDPLDSLSLVCEDCWIEMMDAELEDIDDES